MFLLFQSSKPGSTTTWGLTGCWSISMRWHVTPHQTRGLYKKEVPGVLVAVLHTVLLRSCGPERALKHLLKYSMRIENAFSVCNIHTESKTFTYTLPWVARLRAGSQVIRTRGILLPIPSTTLGLANLEVLVPQKRHTSAKGHNKNPIDQ